MRHELNGTVEHKGERYSYSAIVWDGSDERRGTEIAAIEPDDMPLDIFVNDEDLWDEVAEVCEDDAWERFRLSDIDESETVAEYRERTKQSPPTVHCAPSYGDLVEALRNVRDVCSELAEDFGASYMPNSSESCQALADMANTLLERIEP